MERTETQLPTSEDPAVVDRKLVHRLRSVMEEQPQLTPSTLELAGIEAFPPRPLALRPTTKDPPKPFNAKQLETAQRELKAPTPLERKFKNATGGEIVLLGPKGVGDIPFTEPLYLRADSRTLEEMMEPPQPSKDFELDHSVFHSRKFESDAHAYNDGPEVTLRLFEIAWARANSQSFRQLVSDFDDDGVEGANAELLQVKEVLCNHRAMLFSIFRKFAATSNVLSNVSALDKQGYYNFIREFRILELEHEDQEHLLGHERKSRERRESISISELEQIFITGNVCERRSMDDAIANTTNEEHLLTFFEFLRVVVMLAAFKYIKSGLISDVSEAVSNFIESLQTGCRKVLTAVHDASIFRKNRLYKRDVHEFFSRQEPLLRNVFQAFSTVRTSTPQLLTRKPSKASISQNESRMSFGQWEHFLRCSGILDPRTDPHFTLEEAQYCFIWSQPLVTDEVNRHSKLLYLGYIDFLEAFARVVTFKPLPNQIVLNAYKVENARELFQQIDEGIHDASVMFRDTDWKAEEEKQDPLQEPLEMLLALMMHKFDISKDGVISAEELITAKIMQSQQQPADVLPSHLRERRQSTSKTGMAFRRMSVANKRLLWRNSSTPPPAGLPLQLSRKNLV